MHLKFDLPTRPFIDGAYVDSAGPERLTLHSAVNEDVVVKDVHCANAKDVEIAVLSAEKALPGWKNTPPRGRASILCRFADVIERNSDRIGYADSVVSGKPMIMSRGEAIAAADMFRYFASFAEKVSGELYPVDGDGVVKMVRYEPYGVCAAINPFNSPTATFAMKAGPCLATGNVLITKASENNPLSSLTLANLAVEAGLPPGVMNVIVGAAEAGEALSRHMRIRKISFTGSAFIGRKIQIAAAQSNLKRVTLELGGKSPLIVFGDADLKTAVREATSASLLQNGQACIMGSRMYVHETIADKFIEGLKKSFDGHGATLGADPMDQTTLSSPIYHRNQFNTVLGLLEKGKKEAQVITGGGRKGEKGYYVQPTIFYKPINGADIVTKEIFGPVVVVDTFSSEEDVIARANATEYGLGAYLFTTNLDRALRVSAQIEAGSVSINTSSMVDKQVPFGGWKGSGLGQEMGLNVMRNFTQPKSVTIRYNTAT